MDETISRRPGDTVRTMHMIKVATTWYLTCLAAGTREGGVGVGARGEIGKGIGIEGTRGSGTGVLIVAEGAGVGIEIIGIETGVGGRKVYALKYYPVLCHSSRSRDRGERMD